MRWGKQRVIVRCPRCNDRPITDTPSDRIMTRHSLATSSQTTSTSPHPGSCGAPLNAIIATFKVQLTVTFRPHGIPARVTDLISSTRWSPLYEYLKPATFLPCIAHNPFVPIPAYPAHNQHRSHAWPGGGIVCVPRPMRPPGAEQSAHRSDV